MSVPYSPQHDGSLCGVLGCSGLAEAVADVPLHESTVELSLCVEHLAELHQVGGDPIDVARMWVMEGLRP